MREERQPAAGAHGEEVAVANPSQKFYSVWCDELAKWVGPSPRHVLEFKSTPYRAMLSRDELTARLSARSLKNEFPSYTFTTKETSCHT